MISGFHVGQTDIASDSKAVGGWGKSKSKPLPRNFLSDSCHCLTCSCSVSLRRFTQAEHIGTLTYLRASWPDPDLSWSLAFSQPSFLPFSCDYHRSLAFETVEPGCICDV